METKKLLQDTFQNEEKKLRFRLQSSKGFFIVFALLFFGNFFFLWAGFYDRYFIHTIAFSYLGFVLSLFAYIFFFIKKLLFWKVPNWVFYIVAFFCIVLAVLSYSIFFIQK